MTRRPLAETLIELAEGATAAMAFSSIAVREVAISLPIEIALRRRGSDWILHGDLPRLVTRTAFDTAPSRLDVIWVAGGRA